MTEAFAVYLLLGVFSGFVAGLLGVGGGLIIVPILALVFQAQAFNSEHIMHLALGTSLATIVVTSISAVVTHHRHGAVIWRLVYWLAPGLLVGAVIGAVIADRLNNQSLELVFGVFEIGVAIYMLIGAPKPSGVVQQPGGEYMGAGGVIGTISSLLGIGGGTMTVPYLTWRGVGIRNAVAVSSACGLPIALSGCVSYLITGLDAVNLPSAASGYLYWPAWLGICASSVIMAPVGAKLAHRLPTSVLKRIFAIILLIIGGLMIF